MSTIDVSGLVLPKGARIAPKPPSPLKQFTQSYRHIMAPVTALAQKWQDELVALLENEPVNEVRVQYVVSFLRRL